MSDAPIHAAVFHAQLQLYSLKSNSPCGAQSQYFTVPLPFLQESSGIHRNPQESSGMAPESAGILRNGTRIHRNPQESSGIHRNETGMELELSATRPENQYIYIITCIQIDTTDIIPLSDTFTLICLHTVTSRISTLCYNIYMLKFKWI